MKKSRGSRKADTSCVFKNRRDGSDKKSHKYSIPQSLRSSAYSDLKENIPMQLSQLLDYKLHEEQQTYGKH